MSSATVKVRMHVFQRRDIWRVEWELRPTSITRSVSDVRFKDIVVSINSDENVFREIDGLKSIEYRNLPAFKRRIRSVTPLSYT